MTILRWKELNPCIRKKRWSISKQELPERKSIMVGASSVALAIPALLSQTNTLSFICVNTAIWSYLADYTYASNSEGSIEALGFDVHVVDRYSAFVTVGFFVYKMIIANHLLQVFPLLGLLSLAFLYTRNSPTKSSWFFRHTVWHVVVVLILSYIIHLLGPPALPQ